MSYVTEGQSSVVTAEQWANFIQQISQAKKEGLANAISSKDKLIGAAFWMGKALAFDEILTILEDSPPPAVIKDPEIHPVKVY